MKEIKKQNRLIHYLIALISVILLVGLDQITKYAAVAHLKDQAPYVIIKDVFQLEYLENRGAAFGLFQNQRLFFYLSVLIITGIVLWFYYNVPMERRFLPLRLCAITVVAGAYGNCIDRIRLNYVVDFFYFKWIDFPIFNVADIYVTVSTILLVILIFAYYKEEDLERVFHRSGARGRTD